MAKIKQIWDNILLETETQVSALTFDLWIRTLEPVCIYKDRLVLMAETEAQHSISEKRYHEIIKQATRKVFPSIIDIELITPDLLPSFEQYKEFEMPTIDSEGSAADAVATFVSTYTFENFVVGKSNEFAAAASKAVAEKPGSKYNPLFLYGGVGLGKTHLMHAIGNYLQQYNPKLKAVYASAERFNNELIEAIRDTNRADANKQFRKKYRTVDVLMLDDIQFIAKTTATQEEIFHTFNDLYLAGKQIIISSDRPPKEIAPLEERLRTRFESGLVADISQPDIEMRIAILQRMALSENVHINKEVLQIIAEKVTSNIRDLKGLLTRVISYASLTNSDVNDLEVVMGALKDYADDKKEVITMDGITDEVCRYFGVEKKDLLGKKKNKEIVVPRQICIYLITEFLTVPLISIGEYFGGKDHTTIMHARDKISALIRENAAIAGQVKDVKDGILKR